MIKFEKLPVDILLRIPEVEKFLLQEDNIIFVYLFGGFAKGTVGPLSDIDIAVYVRDSNNLAEYKLELFNEIANTLGTGELDLIILNAVPVSIAGRIVQNKQVLVDKEPFRRHIYESVTLREFFDFKIKEDALFARKYGIG
jgi:predicted nucleotidyltransferase